MYCRTILLVRPPKSYNFHPRSVSTHVNPRTDLRRYLVPPTPIPSYRPTDISCTINARTLVPTYGHILYLPVQTYIKCILYLSLPSWFNPMAPRGTSHSMNQQYKHFVLKHTLLSGTIGHHFHLHPAVNIPDEMSALTDHKRPEFVPGTSHQTLKSEICTIRPPI